MTTPVRIKTTFSRDAYYLGGLKAAGKHLFFTQDGNMHARELWKTDDSSSGTTLVANIRGPFDSSPRLTAVGNTVFFIAEDTSGSDYALWRSNGSASGTIPLKEGLFPSNLTAVGDRLFFSANVGDTDSELWIGWLQAWNISGCGYQPWHEQFLSEKPHCCGRHPVLLSE